MRQFICMIALVLGVSTLGTAQKSLEEYYNTGKQKGVLDLKPEVKIYRIGLSQIGHEFADSLENIYTTATTNISQMTKDGMLSNGVGKYFVKKSLKAKMDVFELEEYFRYRESKYHDYSEFFSKIDKHIATAESRAQESLFFIINEDCREPRGHEKFGNLECWAENIDAYVKKMDVLDGLKTEVNVEQ